MLPNSPQELKFIAKQKKYRPEILEKVYRLFDLLEIFTVNPMIKDKLVLKGGTAINLFCTDSLPRLSLDLDFNYIGSHDRDTMLQEKKTIESIIVDLCQRKNYHPHRNTGAHAGGKMILIYESLLGNKGRLELDLNYLYRTPLWKPIWQSSSFYSKQIKVPILDIHELAAGKLHALLERDAGRDLFDSHQLLTQWPLDKKKLRLAFTVYAGMRKTKWQNMSIEQIQFNVEDIRNKLIPVLKQDIIINHNHKTIKKWAEDLVIECQNEFTTLLPFNDNEKKFLQCLEDERQIVPELLSSDPLLCQAIKNHPALLWRIKETMQLK